MTHSPTLKTLEVQADQTLPIAKEGILSSLFGHSLLSRLGFQGHKKKQVGFHEGNPRDDCVFTYMKTHKNQPKVTQYATVVGVFCPPIWKICWIKIGSSSPNNIVIEN